MPVLAFDVTEKSDEHRRLEFRGEDNSNYYDGELGFASGHVINMRIEKAIVGDCQIYRLVSESGLTFKRAWTHIRNDKTDVTVFWFVRRGTVITSTTRSRYVTKACECTATRSTSAFFMELVPDELGLLDVLHVVVPSYKTESIMCSKDAFGQGIPTAKGELAVTEKMLEVLFENGANVDPDIVGGIAENILAAIAKSLARKLGDRPPPESSEDRRLHEILRCVNINFNNPDLSQSMVAKRCGISSRYLCYILSRHGLSFSNILWEKRLQKSNEWLFDPRMNSHSISEVGYLAGFKSSSHFSRMFKSRFGIAPRYFRSQQLIDEVDSSGECDTAPLYVN